MDNEKKSSFWTGISNIILDNASTAISRVRNWLSPTNSGDDGEEEFPVIENTFALRSILKKNEKKKERKEGTRKKISDHRLKALLEVTELMKLKTQRREREAEKTRRGPLPTVELPASERGPAKITHATLNPDSLTRQQAEEGEQSELPSNRGLLTYFYRLGKGSNGEESVDLLFVKSLLSAGADINIGDKYGQTILHAIARDWHVDIAKFVIQSGADVNACDKFGRTPLHVAAAVNYPEMIEFLESNGGNIHAKTDGELQTPIHYAAKFNSLASLKCLLKLGARVSDQDYKERTPLFLAAEQGRRDVIKFLLDLGVGAAVYDDQGNCAVSLMIDKMPDLAYLALDQFLVEDKPNRKNYYYLCNLEYDVNCKLGRTPARSVLETLVSQKDKNLVQHPVIYKLVEVKWKMLAKYRALFAIAINFIYACLITALAVTLDRNNFYEPLSKKGWRIGVEALFILMTFFFIFQQVKGTKRGKERQRNWQSWRIRCISTDIKYCHPQWPEEKRYLKGEIERIRNLSSSVVDKWIYYEWISFLGIFALVIMQTIYVMKPNNNLQQAIKFSYLVEVFLIWLRLLKPCRTVQALSSLIVMLGDIAKGSIQYLYIFLEFFIPLATSFYIMFGGKENVKLMELRTNGSDEVNAYRNLGDMTFELYWVTLGGSFATEPLQALDRKLANFMISLLFFIMKLVLANLFISMLSHLFQRIHNTAQATALLESADFIMLTERSLNLKNSKRYRKMVRQHYNPLETYEIELTRSNNHEKEIRIHIASITDQIEVLSKLLDVEDEDKTEETNKDEIHEIKRIIKCVEDMQKIQADTEQSVSEKWKRLIKNQNIIKSLISKPEVSEFILKGGNGSNAPRPVRRQGSSTGSVRSMRSGR